MEFRKSMLSMSIAMALLFAAAAQAQTAGAQSSQANPDSQQTQPAQNAQDSQATAKTKKQKVQQLSTIHVTGFAASLGKSLALQRITDATTSVVTAEGIGKFPNTNVAEAMVLMPGVTIDRRFGQGDRVSINGTDPNLNLTFLDGHPMPQIDWLAAGSPDRGFDYSILPSGIVGTIQVFKTAEARLPSGSLGGTIIVHTRNPLDLAPNTLSASVGDVYNEQAGKGKPNASLFYSWKNADSTFGVDVAAAHYGEQINRQGREIFSYSKVSSFAGNPNVAAEIANGAIRPTDLMPAEINAANFQQTRKRNSVLVNLQYKPTNNLQFGLSGLYVKESYNNFNQSMYAFTSATGASSITSLTSNGQGFITGGHSCGVDTPSCAASPVDTELDNGVRFSTVTTTDV
ncbi:MAG: TonB-dependent receptor plug domain-containing protein, partial [Rhodanobacteraceae bacterium]